MDQMDKYSGKRLDGRYEIYERIGSGGMADVYRAYDTIDDRIVAIKILKDEFSGNSEFLRRFRNESKAIAVLSHPNIVKVYDVSFGDRMQYIVMEYIDGITLKEYLSRQRGIAWNEALHFTSQILCALQHAHNKGIVHRDIKPQNIMLLPDGTIKVTDFGIARFSRSETRTMTDKAIGSVHYIAPEQARGDLTDEKADIYSVGVMLYEMVTGQLPFEADNAVSVAIMQLQSDPRPPKELNPNIPDGLEEIILRAMQKNPSQRYQSASEMLRDIDAFSRNPNIVFGYQYAEEPAQTQYVDPAEDLRDSRVPDYDDNYEYIEDDIPPRSTRSKLIVKGIIAGLIVIALLIAGVAIFRACTAEPESDTIELPNFVGMTLEEIQNNPDYTDNFEFVIEYDTDFEKEEGIVLEQKPSGVKEVKIGATITLTVNGGAKEVEVPPLAGELQSAAEEALRKLNLIPKIQKVSDEETAEGHVVKTSPKAGNTVTEGSTVTVFVSTGPSTDEYEVPNVIGDYLDTGVSRITAAGLAKGVVTERDDTGKEAGVIIETDPLPGVKVSKNSPVNIVVSSGKMSSKTIDVTLNLPSNVSQDLTLKVYVGGELSETKTVNPSASTQLSFSYEGSEGKQEVVYYLDDQKYQVIELDFDDGDYSVTWQGEYVIHTPDPTPAPPSDDPDSSSDDNSGPSDGDVSRDDDGDPVG